MDYNARLDQIAVSHLNGTINIYDSAQSRLAQQFTFANHGVLHRIEWNPGESQLVNLLLRSYHRLRTFHSLQLLLAHQNQISLLDCERKVIDVTLNSTGREHLADCTWKCNDVVVGRHRQQILVWDKRVGRYARSIVERVIPRFANV